MGRFLGISASCFRKRSSRSRAFRVPSSHMLDTLTGFNRVATLKIFALLLRSLSAFVAEPPVVDNYRCELTSSGLNSESFQRESALRAPETIKVAELDFCHYSLALPFPPFLSLLRPAGVPVSFARDRVPCFPWLSPERGNRRRFFQCFLVAIYIKEDYPKRKLVLLVLIPPAQLFG